MQYEERKRRELEHRRQANARTATQYRLDRPPAPTSRGDIPTRTRLPHPPGHVAEVVQLFGDKEEK